jgi:CheY-like chemotaxis protein
VLLDLNLPDVQGDEVLQRLGEDPRTREIPVVVISADATPGQIQRLKAAGARDYLTKPIEVQRFVEVVDEYLNRGGR